MHTLSLAAAGTRSTLAAWLGPWSSPRAVPLGVRRTWSRAKNVDIYVYRRNHGPMMGAYLLLPGLHFQGPLEPRLDRFAKILAKAGYLVVSPMLPSFAKMSLDIPLIDEAEVALDFLLAHPELPVGARPGVLSISTGSLPAIGIAGRRSADVGGLLLFGGYADWDEAVRFSLYGADDQPVDPLNRPGVFMNMMEGYDLGAADAKAVRSAWFTYIRRTWGQPHMCEPDARRPLVAQLRANLPPSVRELFTFGVERSPEGDAVAEVALQRARPRLIKTHAKHFAQGVRSPVCIVHGQQDDVMPVTQAHALHALFASHVRTEIYITRLWSHGDGGIVAAKSLFQESSKLLSILKSIEYLGSHPHRITLST